MSNTAPLFNKKLNRIDHTIPLYSPRSTYNLVRQNDELLLSDLTLNFDPFTINVLKNEFYIRNWEMKIVDFILVVKEHLLSWQTDLSNREQKLIRCLLQLFDEIDLNGNGILEWDEFTNFIIEKATVLNNIKTKQDEIKSYTLSNTKLQFKTVNAKKSDENKSDGATIQPKSFNSITKVIYIPDIDRVAFYQEGSDKIYFMNHDSGVLNSKELTIIPKPLSVELSSVKKEPDGTIKIEKKEAVIDRKTIILDIFYIKDKKYQILLTSSNDGYVRGWRYTSNGFVLAVQPNNSNENLEHHFKNDVYCLEWDGVNELLYCGQKDGQINIWNLKTDTESSLDRDSHTKVIMAMIAMPKLQFLASAALDGNLILWDTLNYKKKRVYKEHKRGIVSLAFNEFLILLFSGGFDHDICVWNPYIENFIYKITGHSSPLIGLLVIENTSQVVSLDSEGNLKIWDIKKFNCVQSFSVENNDEKHKFHPQSISYIPRPLKLVISGRTISLYEYDKNYNPNFVDDYVALCAKFVPSSLSFFTPHGNKIKIWNGLTGDIKKIYSEITKAEITAFILDYYCKRMIIGDSSGETAVFNVINGAKIKNLPKHSAEVLKIMHVQDHEMFVTASMDNTIKISDDKKLNESEIIRTIHLPEVVVSYLSYELQNKLIVTGTHNGLIAFWEIETGKLNGTYHEPKDEEITSICSIETSNYIMLSNAIGQISIVGLPPLLFKYTNIHSFTNIDPDTKSAVGIVSMSLCNKTSRIFILDDKGFLKCFDLLEIFTILKTQKNKKVRDSIITTSFLSPPKFDNADFKLIFSVKTHTEQVKSLEYLVDESLIITTAFDKKVKLWEAENGKYIDSFQQNYDKKDPKPIAFKRIGTQEIYNTTFSERIDKAFISHQTLLHAVSKQNQENIKSSSLMREEKNMRKSMAISKEKEGGIEGKNQEESGNVEEKKRKNSFFNKMPEEEFNPFYDFKNIDNEKISGFKSNEWRLYLKFEHYFSTFDEENIKVTSDVKIKEDIIKEKAKKEGVYRRFNVSSFPQADVPNFDQKKLFEEEENNLKKDLESEKNKKENMKKIVDYNKNMRENLINKTSNPLEKKKFADIASKISSEKLYKQDLKGKLLEKQTDVKLSKEECDAAYKLAAALSNYDKDDYRILKFLDIKVKEDDKIKKLVEKKNYLEMNRQKITDMMSGIQKIKDKNKKKPEQNFINKT